MDQFKINTIEFLIFLLKHSRPKTMDDISSQEQAVLVLKKALQSDNVIYLNKKQQPVTDSVLLVTSFTLLWSSWYW